MAQKDKEAADLAKELNERYRRNKYTTDGAEDWAPKAMLMPSEKDPRIWGIKCKVRSFSLGVIARRRIRELTVHFSMRNRLAASAI